MKPFLILQARPETNASDEEFVAILEKCRLSINEVCRIRLDREDLSHDVNLTDYAGIIVGGGPGCISDNKVDKDPVEARIEHRILEILPIITECDLPFMGCCYGLSLLAHHLGGEVGKAHYSEPVGPSPCQLTEDGKSDNLTKFLQPEFDAFVGHKEAVQSLPKSCTVLVESPACPVQMIRYGQNVYATQFHPEASAKDFETRINIYKNHGYFPPEDAKRLIQICNAASVTEPARILRAFAQRYRS